MFWKVFCLNKTIFISLFFFVEPKVLKYDVRCTSHVVYTIYLLFYSQKEIVLVGNLYN